MDMYYKDNDDAESKKKYFKIKLTWTDESESYVINHTYLEKYYDAIMSHRNEMMSSHLAEKTYGRVW